MNDTNQAPSLDHYDRMFRICDGFPHTQPSIVTDAGPLSASGVKRYIVQTFRAPQAGDCIFVEIVDGAGSTRVCLPASVANAIASQRDRLTTRARQVGARQAVKTRRAKGIKPFERKVAP